MLQKVLSQLDTYTTQVGPDDGVVIHTDELKYQIYDSYILKRFLNKEHEDYIVKHCKAMDWLYNYIKDHFNRAFYEQSKWSRGLIPTSRFANLYLPQTSSLSRCHVNPVDIKNSSDYTAIYAVDVGKYSSKIRIEYDDNRRKGRTWEWPVESNRLWIFPSILKYSITKNTSSQINIFFTENYYYLGN